MNHPKSRGDGLRRCLRAGAGVLLASALAACQAVPGAGAGVPSGQTMAEASSATATAMVRSDPVRAVAPNREAVDLRVFLADTRSHPGWTPVPLKPSGLLYVRTDAIIDRSDLMGIQSATDQAGGGVLMLILKDEGLKKVRAATAAHPGLRLALVVGQIMLAAPAYAAPVQEQQLAFGVGSAHNADIAARSVAGVP
ncbi:hypothetical protein [Castellaniella sp.]|uniref:hypothetical protein n=1 Tax=Castellaniella sp. TaxID=1955812 RepID=UPI002AFE4BB5|nr:hypothetical protein [Castellaniella sp.]